MSKKEAEKVIRMTFTLEEIIALKRALEGHPVHTENSKPLCQRFERGMNLYFQKLDAKEGAYKVGWLDCEVF